MWTRQLKLRRRRWGWVRQGGAWGRHQPSIIHVALRIVQPCFCQTLPNHMCTWFPAGVSIPMQCMAILISAWCRRGSAIFVPVSCPKKKKECPQQSFRSMVFEMGGGAVLFCSELWLPAKMSVHASACLTGSTFLVTSWTLRLWFNSCYRQFSQQVSWRLPTPSTSQYILICSCYQFTTPIYKWEPAGREKKIRTRFVRYRTKGQTDRSDWWLASTRNLFNLRIIMKFYSIGLLREQFNLT